MSLISPKKTILIVPILALLATALPGMEKEGPDAATHEWADWVGRKVDVDYRACEPTGCVLVRGAPLKEVTHEAITVVVNGAPFFIPKYMIESLRLSK